MKRFRTKYPGVFYREAERIGGSGKERVYYIVFKRDGKVIEEKVGRQYMDDMTEARAARIRAERIENRRPSRKEVREVKKQTPVTINALWDGYRDATPTHKSRRKERSSWDKHIRPGVGKKEPKELSPLDIDRLRIALQKQGKYTTAVKVLEQIRRALNFGVKRNLIPALPFKITLPRMPAERTEDLNAEQLGRLIAALDSDPDQAAANLMRLALYTGMRKGEILALQWDALDFERGFIAIRNPKGGKDMTIPMNAAARAVLQKHPRAPGSPFLFPGKYEGTHAYELKHQIDRIRKAAQLPEGFRPMHGLRHVYASMLASSGKVDLFTLQKLLTHKSPMMTQRYAHLRDDALKRAAEVAVDIVADAIRTAKEKEDAKKQKEAG
jgi:integrase